MTKEEAMKIASIIDQLGEEARYVAKLFNAKFSEFTWEVQMAGPHVTNVFVIENAKN